MPAWRLVGIAGWLLSAPFGVALLIWVSVILFYTPDPIIQFLADLNVSEEVSFATLLGIFVLPAIIVALFLALPGLLLIALAELIEKTERNRELLTTIAERVKR